MIYSSGPRICGVVVRGLRLHRAPHRCVLWGTAPRPWFGSSALPVLQYEILLFFLGLGFLPFPLLLTSDPGLHLHSLYQVENLLLLPLLPLLQENLETCYSSYIKLDFVSSVISSFGVKGGVSAVVDRMLWPFWASPWQGTRGWSTIE